MTRLHWFLRYQGIAFRALFRRRRTASRGDVRQFAMALTVDAMNAGPGHPCELCRCRDGEPALGVFEDHLPDCAWAAAMCRECGGTGWCHACGGDGTALDARAAASAFSPLVLVKSEAP